MVMPMTRATTNGIHKIPLDKLPPQNIDAEKSLLDAGFID